MCVPGSDAEFFLQLLHEVWAVDALPGGSGGGDVLAAFESLATSVGPPVMGPFRWLSYCMAALRQPNRCKPKAPMN